MPLKVNEYDPYKAKMVIPCVGGGCPGRMVLRIEHVDDGMRKQLETPYYVCQQSGCYYDGSPEPPFMNYPSPRVHPHELNVQWTRSALRHDTVKGVGGIRTSDDLKTML